MAIETSRGDGSRNLAHPHTIFLGLRATRQREPPRLLARVPCRLARHLPLPINDYRWSGPTHPNMKPNDASWTLPYLPALVG
jgi:hypothetical protein